jgi:hypothetical protein
MIDPSMIKAAHVQRRTRQLLCNHDQDCVVIRRQQRLAPRTAVDLRFELTRSAPRAVIDSIAIKA